MKTALVWIGVPAAAFAAFVVWLTAGAPAAVVTLVAVAALVVVGRRGSDRSARSILAVVATGLVALVGFAGWQAVQITSALTGNVGPVDPPDLAALAEAELKLDSAETSTAFRVELTETELSAVIQDGLASSDRHPIRRVDVDLVAADPGRLEFDIAFKRSRLRASGAVTARVVNGAVRIKILDIDLGLIRIPGVGEDALEDLIESIADLNEALTEVRADVQSISFTDTSIVVVGTKGGTDLLTSADLLRSLQQQAASLGGVTPPPERLGPGVVNTPSAPGSPVYVALGDSLAANVGVAEPRDGYVSRFHNQLQRRDGRSYGLRNFGVSGETSGSMIRAGQLDDAVAFMEDNDIAYVTIDIGANDLLGHLSSQDCSENFDGPACRQRIDTSFELYESNIVTIFDAIEPSAPDATVIFMRVYNPFSLGFGRRVDFEQRSNEAVSQLNDIGAAAAAARGFLVADAFTPMLGTTAATTHMVDSPPDIHPLPIGYDILAGALLDALR